MKLAWWAPCALEVGWACPGVGTNMHPPSWADPLKTGGDIREGSS